MQTCFPRSHGELSGHGTTKSSLGYAGSVETLGQTASVELMVEIDLEP